MIASVISHDQDYDVIVRVYTDDGTADRPKIAHQCQRLAAWTRRAGWSEITALLDSLSCELTKSERERRWPLGRCVWCDVDTGRLREATVLDFGGGPPTCQEHAA